MPFYGETVALYCVAALLEKLSEPMQIVAILNMDLASKVKIEVRPHSLQGSSMTVKCVSIYLLLLAGFDLLAFGIAQLLYSASLFLLYLWFYSDGKKASLSTFFRLGDL